MRGSAKLCLAVMAALLTLGVHAGQAQAQAFGVVTNFTDHGNVKVVVVQDGKETNKLTLARDTGAAAFMVKGKSTLTLHISGAPHNGSVTVSIKGVKDFQGLILQITENGFVNYWRADKSDESKRIK